jgi:hypothetical protein
MDSKKLKEYAKDIVLVLKYNHDLKEEDKILAVECRLLNIASELKEDAIEFSDHSTVLPVDLIKKNPNSN